MCLPFFSLYKFEIVNAIEQDGGKTQANWKARLHRIINEPERGRGWTSSIFVQPLFTGFVTDGKIQLKRYLGRR